MKHHGFAAKEALGYIRVCRPGSVIGPQQNFVVAQEARMQAAGAEFCKVDPGNPKCLAFLDQHLRFSKDV